MRDYNEQITSDWEAHGGVFHSHVTDNRPMRGTQWRWLETRRRICWHKICSFSKCQLTLFTVTGSRVSVSVDDEDASLRYAYIVWVESERKPDGTAWGGLYVFTAAVALLRPRTVSRYTRYLFRDLHEEAELPFKLPLSPAGDAWRWPTVTLQRILPPFVDSRCIRCPSRQGYVLRLLVLLWAAWFHRATVLLYVGDSL